jgi:transcription initiation factor TFIID subunit 2
MIELAVSRGCTTKAVPDLDTHANGDIREVDAGWPGMMSVRVNETDGAYDHPVLPMAGEALQVVEIQCHSKVAPKRVWKSKKNTKNDGADDNIDVSTQENRSRSISSNPPYLLSYLLCSHLMKSHFNFCLAALIRLYCGSE